MCEGETFYFQFNFFFIKHDFQASAASVSENWICVGDLLYFCSTLLLLMFFCLLKQMEPLEGAPLQYFSTRNILRQPSRQNSKVAKIFSVKWSAAAVLLEIVSIQMKGGYLLKIYIYKIHLLKNTLLEIYLAKDLAQYTFAKYTDLPPHHQCPSR